jgi:small subunit ribosomal protein S6
LPAVAPTYDLVLLLDPQAEDAVRDKALADVRSQIGASGEVLLDQSWGTRSLAYPIAHREQADYHLLQLHGDGELIASLERNLRIADGVLRHRIIKLAPGTPAPPEQGPRERSAAPPAAPAAAPPAAPAAAPASEAAASDGA